MKNLITKRKLISVLLAGNIALTSLTGCSIKPSSNSYEYEIAEFDDNTLEENGTDTPRDIEIIIPSTYDYYDAYKTVDKIKRIISNNKVGNVYIDIDPENEEISVDYLLFVKKITDKLEANGIKFTLVGEENNLNYFSFYDTMVKCSDKKNIDSCVEEYGKAYYEDKVYYQGEIEEITNTDEGFIKDEKYIVREGDSLIKIAEKYNISDYKSLGYYNNIEDLSLIRPGDGIIIPSSYEDNIKEEIEEEPEEEIIEEIETEEEFVEESTTIDIEMETDSEDGYVEVDEELYYKGIDVSAHQEEIDWDIAKEKIDFAIIRIADTYNKDENGNYLLDTYYRSNIEACQERDIPVGVYIYSRALTKEDMQKEIDFVLENLKDENDKYYDITRPIYIDIEEECEAALNASEESRKNQVELIEMFCAAMEREGYAAGVYINSKNVSKISELYNTYSIWVSGGDLAGYLYHKEQDIDNMYYGYTEEDEFFTSTYGINVVQPTSKGDGESVGVSSSYVDLDYADKEFFDALDRKFGKDNSYVIR